MTALQQNPYCYDRWFQAAGILLAGMVFLVAADQLFYWDKMADYHFGFIVPIFVAFVVYDRRETVARFLTTKGPQVEGEEGRVAQWLEKYRQIFTGLAYAGAAGGLTVFALGSLIRTTQGPTHLASLMVAFGFAATLLSMAYILYHTRVDGSPAPVIARLGFAMLFLFPALIWLISTPMLIKATNLELHMMGWVAVMVSGTFNLFGEPVQRLGNLLVLPSGEHVGVEEACSGIRSLTACMFAGSFLGAVFLNRFWKKVLLVMISVLCAFILNFVRSLFLTIWASVHGAGAIENDFFGNPREIQNAAGDMIPNPEFFLGTVHDIAGYAILAVTFVMLMSLLPVLNFKLSPDDDDDSAAASTGGTYPRPAEA
ncbi:MAG: exosortase/archaeosortase family protein [Opitutales bacterium]